MAKNMEIYDLVRSVPESAQKSFNNGRFSGTDIKPQWRIEKMTEVFGACGIGWYFDKPEYEVQIDGQTKTVYCTVALYIKVNGEWSKPIYGTGGNTITSVKKDGSLTITDEGYKMAYTDAQSNACKLIGVGADIWYNNSETKYTAQETRDVKKAEAEYKAKEEQNATLADALKLIASCKTSKEVLDVWNKYPSLQKVLEFKSEITAKGKAFKDKEAKEAGNVA